MLNSLHIQNYKNLKDISFPSLKRVNLITGKNNTGKSSLLEAISIYACKADVNWLYQLLEERDEISKTKAATFDAVAESHFDALDSLFNDRTDSYPSFKTIVISPLNESHQIKTEAELSICIGTFNYEENTQNKNLENNAFSYGPSLEIKFGKAFKIFSLLELGKRYYYFSKQPIESNFQLITTLNLERDLNAKLWGKITLTPKQNDVTETLKIIEQNLDGINIIQSTDTGQKPLAVVKLKNEMNVVPMKSLGDGINRIFNISLALVNSDNGYLLIDEFENGLHYSVQEKLWEIIFTMSKKLNVQVFATTHSYDCVRAFEKIVNNGFKDEGALIKLENVNGEVKNVRFDSNELLIASEHNIELR